MGFQGLGSHVDERSRAQTGIGWQPRCRAGRQGEHGEEDREMDEIGFFSHYKNENQVKLKWLLLSIN